ncbi:putative odorant-binding protein A10 [Neocloeon triangulifer]|uniref:putative odorant-binding protein A10 n=1 Tax=Neocloeon triangulifer TaxID=2078957 RepID=UPI00286F7C2D|nr:putative odorant-binding protein A10 [Neocloeon triangulifer]
MQYTKLAMRLSIIMMVLVLGLTAEETDSAPAGVAPTSLSDQTLQNAIKDKRYMLRQIKCTLGEVPCDPVGRKLKALAPLVIKNICFQCTPQEKRQIQMVVSHIQRNYPAEWAKIVRQFGST